MQRIIYTHSASEAIEKLVEECQPDRVFVLCDTHTEKLCLPRLSPNNAEVIPIPATDSAKTLTTLSQVWDALQKGGATRHSLLVNLGGGMVTDLGGFAAATFKRGIRFVNIPTTLLAMVDAAVGGKTGINFGGLKNEVGAFCEADAVVIDTHFLSTLDTENLRSGYAEMLKHALLTSREMWLQHLQFDLSAPDFNVLQNLVRESIEVKQRIVTEDPHEKGIRKALNLGHTVAHAIEAYYLRRAGSEKKAAGQHGEAADDHVGIAEEGALLHGYAVAWGLVCALYISAANSQFSTADLHATARFVFDYYGRPAIGCNDYDALYDYMRHDKKNCGSQINFTLLSAIGQILINQQADQSVIFESIDFLRDA